MDKLNEEFEEATKKAESKVKNYSDNDKLEIYKYYKQATIGDINIVKPGFLYFKDRAKWDAWNSVKGLAQTEAMKLYIKKINDT